MPTDRETAPPRRNALRDAWVDWLSRGCSLPLDHVALVLELDPSVVDAFLHRTKHGRRRAVPTRPPRPGRAAGAPSPPILAQTAVKVRRLAELKYPAARIAEVLELDPPAVRDFLTRSRPVRRAAVSRPRGHAEQAALKANRHRRANRLFARRQRQAARMAAAAPPAPRSTWDRRKRVSDAELDQAGAKLAAIAAAAVAELARAEAPAPPPAELPATRHEWTGSSSPHARGEDHGSAKLSRADVKEIRRLRAAGSSTGELAKGFGVSRATICYAVSGVTWGDVAPPALPRADHPEKQAESREIQAQPAPPI